MEQHTIEAVMSLPEDLFHNSKVGVITCALVVVAHVPHKSNKKTWLGYWRKDGFIKVKGKGRIDKNHVWDNTKSYWLNTYFNRDEVDGYSARINLKAEDEWCVEAYLETDYSQIDKENFLEDIKKYLAFEIVS